MQNMTASIAMLPHVTKGILLYLGFFFLREFWFHSLRVHSTLLVFNLNLLCFRITLSFSYIFRHWFFLNIFLSLLVVSYLSNLLHSDLQNFKPYFFLIQILI